MSSSKRKRLSIIIKRHFEGDSEMRFFSNQTSEVKLYSNVTKSQFKFELLRPAERRNGNMTVNENPYKNLTACFFRVNVHEMTPQDERL